MPMLNAAAATVFIRFSTLPFFLSSTPATFHYFIDIFFAAIDFISIFAHRHPHFRR